MLAGWEDLLHDRSDRVQPGPVWELGVVVSSEWAVLWGPGWRVLPLCGQAGSNGLHSDRLDPRCPHAHRLAGVRRQLPTQSQHRPTDSVSHQLNSSLARVSAELFLWWVHTVLHACNGHISEKLFVISLNSLSMPFENLWSSTNVTFGHICVW